MSALQLGPVWLSRDCSSQKRTPRNREFIYYTIFDGVLGESIAETAWNREIGIISRFGLRVEARFEEGNYSYRDREEFLAPSQEFDPIFLYWIAKTTMAKNAMNTVAAISA